MCFDANTSLATFSISFLSAAYLYNKNNKLDKFLAVATILIGLMQLLEFFIWKNQQCSQINHMLSLLIIVLLTMQPILGLNYYNKLFNRFNKKAVALYSLASLLFTGYNIGKLNKYSLCSKPTSKSCRLNWDAFTKINYSNKLIPMTFFIFYFVPQLLIGLSLYKNNKNDMLKRPFTFTFLPATFITTLLYVCYTQNIFHEVAFDPYIYLENTDVWGTMWCFMSVFLGLLAIAGV